MAEECMPSVDQVTNNVLNHCGDAAALHSIHASPLVNPGSFQAKPENVIFGVMKCSCLMKNYNILSNSAEK
jgi:hypothetical protein